MDASELIDPRPNDDAPLAFWRDRIVLSVHHDGAGAMPVEWKIMTGRLVHRMIFRSAESLSPVTAHDTVCWLLN